MSELSDRIRAWALSDEGRAAFEKAHKEVEARHRENRRRQADIWRCRCADGLVCVYHTRFGASV